MLLGLLQDGNFPFSIHIDTQWKSKSKLGSYPQVAQSTALRLQIKLTWFEEIFEEYDKEKTNETRFLSRKLDLIRQNDITKSGLSIQAL